ncbi:MAG: ribonucleoside triphosphate reductase [Candidatus Nomurabacteria bacterium]
MPKKTHPKNNLSNVHINTDKFFVKKRDGRKQKFSQEKITLAIAKAGTAAGEFNDKKAPFLAQKVFLTLLEKNKKTFNIEEVQDVVEDVLMSSKYKATAKAYILYRDQHRIMREMNAQNSIDLINQYTSKSDWLVKENSNMDYSLQGLNNYIAAEISKTYWLNNLYSKEIREAHLNADFHLHDLSTLAVYCVGWDLFDLLKEGFRGVKGKVASAPPKHFRTALGQIVNFIYTMQGEAAGAIALSNFDTLLAPFIRYDGLNFTEIKQCIQEFIFNMNVPTRVGFQTPFSNITLDLLVSPNFKDTPVIIGGKMQKETYSEFQEEVNLFNKAFFEVMHKGDAAGRVFSFPIPTVNITKDFDFENENLNGLWEITAKYGVPYFSNFVNSDMNPEDARSMCCRLRLDLNELTKRGGGLFGANALTGSMGVVTINMPRLGYLSKNVEDFKERLKKIMLLARESLEVKREIIENFTDKNLYPYTKFYLRNIKTNFGKYWVNHFSTIGLIGLNEAAENLLGVDIGTEKGNKFAEDILVFMREILVQFQEETGNLYNLEATPAEGVTYRLARKDTELFPLIKTANQGDGTPFYSNSSQLPVNYTDDIFESLNLQDKLQTLYTGGTVIHLFLGEQIHDIKMVPNLVKKICQNYHLPYFSITPTFSVCDHCGYLSGEQTVCKDCGEETEIYTRVVGFLRPIHLWNDAKRNEFTKRKTFSLIENKAVIKK